MISTSMRLRKVSICNQETYNVDLTITSIEQEEAKLKEEQQKLQKEEEKRLALKIK